MLIVHFKQLYYEYFSYFLRKWGTEKVNIKSDGGAEKAAGVTFPHCRSRSAPKDGGSWTQSNQFACGTLHFRNKKWKPLCMHL